MANSGGGDKPLSWADIVGRVPARMLTYAAASALGAFVLLVAMTLVGYWRGDAITVASWQFGKAGGSSTQQFPTDVVLAFDSEGCPKGWTTFEKSVGRFMIGASPNAVPSQIPYLTSADLRAGITGGTRMVNIEYPLPMANTNQGFATALMADASIVFVSEGGNLARYYVLPPYVAMTFCRVLGD